MTDETMLLHEKINADLRFLLECLEEVLFEIGEGEVAALIPWRENSHSPSFPVSIERACQLYSISFQLLGMVEENAAVQVRRVIETARGPSHERGLWGNTLLRLKDDGFGEDEIAAALERIHVEPVLTAHPTEAKRGTIITKHRALYLLMVKRENPKLTPAEQFQIREEIKELLELLWRTGNIQLEKPEVQTELRSIIHYLVNVFPEAMPILDRRLKAAWSNAGCSEEALKQSRLPRLTFGTWVGGDRDGHPLVTAEVTRDALHELRLRAILMLRRRLVDLAGSLSLSDHLQAAPEHLLRWIEERERRLGSSGTEACARNQGESWRQAINLMIASLPVSVVHDQGAKLEDSQGRYATADELSEDLAMLDASVRAVGGARPAEIELFNIRRLVDSMGFHLAALDIRQNSDFHDRAVSQLLTAAGVEDADFSAWPEEKRVEFLKRELALPRPFLLPGLHPGHEAEAVLECYRVLATHIRTYGAEGIGSLIVSMTRGASDLLALYLLAREAGLLVYEEGGCRCLLQVVPLFETIDDLERAPQILRQFLEHPVTRATLAVAETGRPLQQVMIGYSDSCKDGGIIASHGALFRAQLELTAVGDSCGVDIRFFHGRGGSIGRGAGPTFRFLEALPPGSLRGCFRMTEQGETISQKYSNLLTATYNLELQLAGVFGMTVRGARHAAVAPEQSAIMEFLVGASRSKYEELISRDGFIDFFSQATPIDVMEHLKIGSRPSRRTGRRTLKDLRAIPWVFSWNQSRFMLPSWYGAGTALSRLKEAQPHSFELLSADIGRFPLLRYLFMNVELAVLQADREIMNWYAGLVESGAIRDGFMERIDREFELTLSHLRLLFKAPLGERRPMQLKALSLRHAPLAALHRHQVDLLRQWRSVCSSTGEGDEAKRLMEELFLTVNAIAGGIRNTG
ncbi:phosphoenolpyruvate carboxylase [Geobacter sp. DSM 9736]|uniref:phosphoenolpyruvate carboxylase n=1 Tax=Geobacter sp. DSM 9736 TaxID=1277350 RepID=UPI000B5F76C7|nr:phosphoenolpyruvate carboxylase [Geobacter sp. DSM 9736]SNB46302.1 Phosphoenolpyruvate carboxylase, type 1 [Geobacter sp. DSM 9736]